MLRVKGRGRCTQAGVVGLNLTLTIAFALYAVIQLSRVTLAAKQIDDRVKVIVSEVGPGSNVSRLDETARLNETGRIAEDILTAAKPLSGQAQTIIDTTASIDTTVSDILRNATEINGTVRNINGTASQLLPVVRTINDGVAAINGRADKAIPIVAGIRTDLNRVAGHVGSGGTDAHSGGSIHGHVNSINCSSLVVATAPAGCGL